MSKNAWIIITLIAIVVLILGGSLLYFSKKEETKKVSPYSEENQTNQNSEKSILLFSFSNPEANGLIDNEENVVTIIVPLGTDLKTLKPNIIISDGASISPASGAEQDFTNPIVYKVAAQDGSSKDYTVTVVPETEAKGS